MKRGTKEYIDARIASFAHQFVMVADNMDTRISTLEQQRDDKPNAQDVASMMLGSPANEAEAQAEVEAWLNVAMPVDMELAEGKPLPLTTEQRFACLVNERLFALFDAVWAKEKAALLAEIAALQSKVNP